MSKLRIIKPCALSFTSKVYNGSLVSNVLESGFLVVLVFLLMCINCQTGAHVVKLTGLQALFLNQ